jgi:hypothetical protein
MLAIAYGRLMFMNALVTSHGLDGTPPPPPKPEKPPKPVKLIVISPKTIKKSAKPTPTPRHEKGR